MGRNYIYNQPQIVLFADLNDFLAQVVAKLVGHDFCEKVSHVLQKSRDEVGIKLVLESLLDHPATNLVKGKFVDVCDNFQLFFRQFCNLCLAKFTTEEGQILLG